MEPQPTLRTERLSLRPFTLLDADDVQRLAGDVQVASTTLHVPHPYPDGAAEEWIASHAPGFAHRTNATFAITMEEDGSLVGAIGLGIQPAHAKAELGYWIGVPYWGRRFATEAGRALIAFGFRDLVLNRIFASHMTRNPASGRVLEQIGMRREGLLRQDARKWGAFEDVAIYGILAADWRALERSAAGPSDAEPNPAPG